MGSELPHRPAFWLGLAAGDDGWTIVSVAGEVDIVTAEEFSRGVRTGLAAGDVLIDLRDVAFMDSSGVRALNGALNEAADAGRQLRVSREMKPAVVRLLEMTGMLPLLPVEDEA